METLKTLPDVPCIFNIDDDSLAIEINANEGVYKLSGYWGDDFPKIPELEDPKTAEISSSIIKNAVSKTLFAVGNDDMRITMTGVFCELTPENVTFVFNYRKQDIYDQLDLGAYWVKDPFTLGAWFRGLPVFSKSSQKYGGLDAVILLVGYKINPKLR